MKINSTLTLVISISNKYIVRASFEHMQFLKWFIFGLLLANSTSIFAAADLGWDLTYKKARSEANMGAEFMQVWPRNVSDRQIQQKVAAYSGERIEASLLIERPDGHTGDPYVSWIIVTKNSAKICSFHPKIDESCKPLDTNKARQIIKEIYDFKPLKNADLKKRVIDDNIGINYIGFLSIFTHGNVLQRPIAYVEQAGDISSEERNQLGDQAGRLSNALARLLLTDKELKKSRVAQGKQTAKRRFFDAVVKGDLTLMQSLLDADKEAQYLNTFILNKSLPLAVSANRINAIDFLLKQGANIDSTESAALKAAVKAKNVDMVQYLLGKGAHIDPPPETSDYHGQAYSSALGEAVFANNTEMVKMLIDKGADVNFSQSRTIITKAALNGNYEMVDYLLNNGANPELISNEGGMGKTTLGFLMQRKHNKNLEKIIRRIVKAGANVNLINSRCDTYLSMINFWTRDQGMKKLMIELGADQELQESCFKSTWPPEQYQERLDNLKKRQN